MSVINKMLQELDRRQALGSAADPKIVRAPSAKTGGHEWFWRVLVVLLAAALCWVGWVAFQLVPRKPLATELAHQAAEEARSRPKPAPVAQIEEQKPEVKPEARPIEPTPPPEPEPPRLALQLETPLAKPKPPPVEKIEKRVIAPAAVGKAEAHFRRASLLANQGKASEAEGEFVEALRTDPAHTPARQAYVALLLEQQRVGSARRVLQEGLALNPEDPAFAVAQARIHAGQREYAAALEVLDRAGPAGNGAEFQAMRAAVLQRLGRHGEAVEAYQEALRGAAQPAATWIGLGISLEALGRRSDAVLAYRRALSTRPLAAEARDYAESRARALE